MKSPSPKILNLRWKLRIMRLWWLVVLGALGVGLGAVPPALPRAIAERWHAMETVEKLDYLLTSDDWYALRSEYDALDANKDGKLEYPEFENVLIEFTNIEDIIRFWLTCDVDKSQDVTLIEYVQARGQHEKYGRRFEQDEYSQRENTLLEEYYELLRRDEPQPERFEYDEDGIIIREL